MAEPGRTKLWTYGVPLFAILIFYYLLLNHDRSEDSSNTPQHYHQTLSSSIFSPSLQNLTLLEFLNSKENLSKFNRLLWPHVEEIVKLDYFRYVKVNISHPCKLWCNSGQCNQYCQVKTSSDPPKCLESIYEDKHRLSTVNTEVASDKLDLLIRSYECNDSDDHDSPYVDLLKNPERYTGYSGETAHRIWRAIYQENCFVSSRSPLSQDLCHEERLFYETISGLHSSINIHLCAEYPSSNGDEIFEPNVSEFLRRFEGHNDYLENLYTLFLLELRALNSSKSYLVEKVNWPDDLTKFRVQKLLSSVDKFDVPLLEDLSLKPSHVSHQLAIHFRNITTNIIDCVGCDKCKLWGKVQLRGLGAAFKILFLKDMGKLHLNHQEIISLINAIARLSHSIRQLDEFKQLILEPKRGERSKTKVSSETKKVYDLFIK